MKYAVDCLENNGWDVDRAIANFEQVKVSKSRLSVSLVFTLVLQTVLSRDAFM